MSGSRATPEQVALYNAKAAIIEMTYAETGCPVTVERLSEGAKEARLLEYTILPKEGSGWGLSTDVVDGIVADWAAEQWLEQQRERE